MCVILLFVWLTGCSENCDDYSVPLGYMEVNRFQQSDYESITYRNGNHWITYTTTDGGCHWEKSEYWD